MEQGRFERMTASVARRIADLLEASVLITDEAGAVVASCETHSKNGASNSKSPLVIQELTRIPIRHSGWSGEVIIGKPTADLLITLRVAQSLVYLVIEQAFNSAQVQYHEQIRDKFVSDLLRGKSGVEAEVLREGELIELDLTRPHVAMAIDASDYLSSPPAKNASGRSSSDHTERLQLIVRSIMDFFGPTGEVICSYMGKGEVVILAATDSSLLLKWTQSRTEDEPYDSWTGSADLRRVSEFLLDHLKSELGCELRAGVGRYHQGLAGLAHSYRDAHDALTLGLAFEPAHRVYSLDSLGIIAFVSETGEFEKRELADRLLLPLSVEPDLLHTLDIYLALDCHADASAGKLAIHRNTLRYRLDRIAALTGLDPRNFNQAVELRLARLLQSKG